MDKQQVEVAIAAGLELLGDKSNIAIPARLSTGVFFLKNMLLQIAQGQLVLQQAMETNAAPATAAKETKVTKAVKSEVARKR